MASYFDPFLVNKEPFDTPLANLKYGSGRQCTALGRRSVRESVLRAAVRLSLSSSSVSPFSCQNFIATN